MTHDLTNIMNYFTMKTIGKILLFSFVHIDKIVSVVVS